MSNSEDTGDTTDSNHTRYTSEAQIVDMKERLRDAQTEMVTCGPSTIIYIRELLGDAINHIEGLELRIKELGSSDKIPNDQTWFSDKVKQLTDELNGTRDYNRKLNKTLNDIKAIVDATIKGY